MRGHGTYVPQVLLRSSNWHFFMSSCVWNCHHWHELYLHVPLAILVRPSSEVLFVTFSFLLCGLSCDKLLWLVLATYLSCFSCRACIVQVPCSFSTWVRGESPGCFTESISLLPWQDGPEGAWPCWVAAEGGHDLRLCSHYTRNLFKLVFWFYCRWPCLISTFSSPFFFLGQLVSFTDFQPLAAPNFPAFTCYPFLSTVASATFSNVGYIYNWWCAYILNSPQIPATHLQSDFSVPGQKLLNDTHM